MSGGDIEEVSSTATIIILLLSLTLVSFTHLIIIGMNVCGSAYENGCVVDGMCATAAD